MRALTKTYTLYRFEELSTDAQERIIESYQSDEDLGWWAIEEGVKSLEAYCAEFGVTLEEWSIDLGYRNYVKTDVEPGYFRGLKLKHCTRDKMPTGCILDCYFFETFYDEFKLTGNAYHAFNEGLETGFQAIIRDAESCYERESIIAMIEANDYEYYENGELAIC